MTQLWIPRVVRIPATKAGVPFTTRTGRRAVWHTTEGTSISGAVAAYRAHGGWPHLTWDPTTGDIRQHYPANVGSRALRNTAGGVETNSYGALQIEVVGYARRPFTSGPTLGVGRILAWLRANGVPDVWPMGQPLAYGPDERRPGVVPAAYGLRNGNRSSRVWLSTPGHYAHSQVPENDHGDPGRINISFVKPTQPEPPKEWDEMASKDEIRSALWDATITTDSGKKMPALTALEYVYKRVTRLEAAHKDEEPTP